MDKKSDKIFEIQELIQSHIETQDHKPLDQAVKIISSLCSSPFFPSSEKLVLLCKLSKYEEDVEGIKSLIADIMSKWRDSLNFLKERGLMKGLGILGIIGGLFFLSPNLTGNTIANLTQNYSNILGIILFALGILGIYLSFKKS